MRLTRIVLGLTLVLALVGVSPVPAGAQAPADRSAGRWIVVLRADARSPSSVAAEHARGGNATISHVYDTALRGYAAAMSRVALERARRDSRVAYIERDQTAVAFHHRPGHGGGGDPQAPAACADDETVPWGVERVGAPDNSQTNFGDGICGNGPRGATVYVIDSGTTSPDLDVVGSVNFIRGRNRDCNGHGTHVAGTAAAIDNGTDVIGVAHAAPVVALRVLNCRGSGSYSGIIAAVDYVAGRSGRRVANLSLGGPPSNALDAAISRAAGDGVFFALAAGNSGADACNYSPARVGRQVSGVVTVGATTASNRKASFSNDGRCVELWAPGVSIPSLAVNGGTTTLSGTSMASPHVAGGAALWLTANGGSPAQVESALRTRATNAPAGPLLNVAGF